MLTRNMKESSACCCAEDTFQAGSGSECSCSNGMQADRLSAKRSGLELLEKLKEAEEKQEEYLKMAQRVQADFDNYKGNLNARRKPIRLLLQR